jgi:transcriptional regulator with XRE-family HTH domain
MGQSCQESIIQVVPKYSTITRMTKKPQVNLARLKTLMKEKTWGLGELATYSGVKYDTVYSLVKGRRPNSNIATLKNIAGALGVSVDYLLGQSDERGALGPALPETMRQLTEIANRLPEMRQEELVRIARALLELERERAQNPMPVEKMRALLELSEYLRGTGEGENLLLVLKPLLDDLPAAWLLELRPDQQAPDSPAQGK